MVYFKEISKHMAKESVYDTVKADRDVACVLSLKHIKV